jgi:glutamate dehydrogenase/leucine dehydrogenase
VIPDILCNAGGVFVSYLEYTQETQREQMTIDQVERRLGERMRTRFTEVEAYAAKKMFTMREAAMDIWRSDVWWNRSSPEVFCREGCDFHRNL